MVIGDPHKFSIMTDIVDEWSSNGFIAGLFYISIDGVFFPKGIINTTLNSELYKFFENGKSSLLTKPINMVFFSDSKVSVYKKIYEMTFPTSCDENNYLYSCCFDEMESEGCFLFSVSDGNYVRILGARVPNDDFFSSNDQELDRGIYEVFVSVQELDRMLCKLRGYYDNYIDLN